MNPALLFAVFCAVFMSAGSRAVAEEIIPKPLARFALLADPHVNQKTNGNAANYKLRFEKAITAVNAAQVDFALIAGDLTQDGRVEEMREFKKRVKKFEAPVYFVPGNHDVGNKFNAGKGGLVTAERVKLFEKELGPTFFEKRKAGLRIIGINSPVLGSGFAREDAQWKFLETALRQPSDVPTILFTHYPLFVATSEEPGGVYKNMEPVPRKRLLDLIKQAGVKTVLSGHLHHQLINRAEGIHFISVPPISFGLPAGKQPEGWMLITLFAEKESTWDFHAIE